MPVTKSLILTALLAFPLAANAATSPEVEKVLAQAEASLAKARESGNSWTTTGKLVTAARQAVDQNEAMELAQRALLTADMARQQHTQEQDAWQARVPAN